MCIIHSCYDDVNSSYPPDKLNERHQTKCVYITIVDLMNKLTNISSCCVFLFQSSNQANLQVNPMITEKRIMERTDNCTTADPTSEQLFAGTIN